MSFDDLNLSKPLLNALSDLGLSRPTAIQAKVFSPIMAGRDVVGIAQTGTGKTFAYLLPCLRLWKFTKSPQPQILIIVPTRELVMQVVSQIESLSTYMNVVATGVYGGTNMKRQKVAISDGVDIIVGTPGRLVDLMLDGVLKTRQLKRLIIDEVDEMLNLGFRSQLKNIIEFLPAKRQHLMFSATMTDEVEDVIRAYTDYYEKIEAAPSGAPLEHIVQYAYAVPNFLSKSNLLAHLLEHDKSITKLLIFVSTKKMADALYEHMEPMIGESLGVIHSSKSQNNRFATVQRFDEGTCPYLIATDIVARGLDVSEVTHVINFDLTDTAEKYIHRIGRTGRAEQKGVAISFVSKKEEEIKEDIEALMALEIPMREVPEAVRFTEELIPLEKPVVHIPFDSRKQKQHKPSGPAFHEKLSKNKKVNKRMTRAERMKLRKSKRGAKKKR